MLTKIFAAALVVEAQADDKPLGVVFSGNGNRAQAGAVGMLKALNEADAFGGKFGLQDVSTISSVSGGSWGTTQFLFSDTFNEGVLSSTQNISSWYTNYQAVATGGMGKAMQACGGAMNCQTGLISGMYEGFNPKFDATKAASPENRLATAGNADYLVCTSLVVQGLMSDNTTTTLYKGPEPLKALDFPAYWAIPKSAKPTWNVPEISVADLTVKSDATGKTAPLVLPPPSVGTIGAMSSAASGGSGVPALKAATLAANQKSTEMWCKQFPCSGPHEAETAVCSNAAADDINNCTFPSVRFIDGAFTENQALALAIAHMQKKHPGKMLTIIGTNADACDGTADPIQCVKISSMRSLFANGPYPTDTGEWRPYVIPSPNRTIFAESITDEQALGTAIGPATVTQQTYLAGVFTTIDNVHFGVSAGTKVDLTLINMNGGPLQAMNAQEMADLGSMAAVTKAATVELLSKHGKADEVLV